MAFIKPAGAGGPSGLALVRFGPFLAGMALAGMGCCDCDGVVCMPPILFEHIFEYKALSGKANDDFWMCRRTLDSPVPASCETIGS
jgi:hypothetical protein